MYARPKEFWSFSCCAPPSFFFTLSFITTIIPRCHSARRPPLLGTLWPLAISHVTDSNCINKLLHIVLCQQRRGCALRVDDGWSMTVDPASTVDGRRSVDGRPIFFEEKFLKKRGFNYFSPSFHYGVSAEKKRYCVRTLVRVVTGT